MSKNFYLHTLQLIRARLDLYLFRALFIFCAVASYVKLRRMRLIKRFPVSVFVYTFFLVSILSFQTLNLKAQTTNNVNIKGLKDTVTVRRDERGIPYIEAKNADDLYFAQGYVTASDRLWQMDLLRRVMRGEISEIFGRVPFQGTTTVEQDKLRRKYGWHRIADASFENMSPQMKAALVAYAKGVNAYIDSLDEKSLPVEFQILRYKPRHWTPTDTLIAGKVFPEGLSMTWRADILRASLSDLPKEKKEKLLMEISEDDVLVVGNDNVKANTSTKTKTASISNELLKETAQISKTIESGLSLIGFNVEDRAASNNWVVSGKRTKSGKPLLANDPHLDATAPSIWYMVNLSMPGMRVAGVTTPGYPGVLLGHNEYIAWGATNLGPDVQDLYLETFDANNPRKYKTPEGWKDADVFREEIKVRKSLTGNEIESEFFDVTVTRHGPIFLERDNKRYALRWTAFDPKANEAEGFFRFNYARNWKDFTDALNNYKGVTFNFVYADVAGNIGYYGAGGIPVRKSGDGSVPYDGAKDEGEWIGYIPLKELPFLYNPPDGIIVTANQRVVGKSYKHHLSYEWPAPYRAKRIKELLLAKPKHDADSYRDIQADIYNAHLKTFMFENVKLAVANSHASSSGNGSNDDMNFLQSMKMIMPWDGRMTVDSKAAPIVLAIRTVFRRKIIEAAVGKERANSFFWANESAFFNWLIKTQPKEWLPAEYKDYLALLKDCEKEARANLTRRLGEDESKWTWGNFNQARLTHPLSIVPLIGGQFAIAPFAIQGSGNAPNVGIGVSMRLIAEPGNWNATRQSIQLGQSGNPKSPYWKDQMQEWINATPRIFPFSQKAVEAAAKETLVLSPANDSSKTYRGLYSFGFEVSSFKPCGDEEKWWVVYSSESVSNALFSVKPDGGYRALYLEAKGTVTDEGQYGHLGEYKREFNITAVVKIQKEIPADCK